MSGHPRKHAVDGEQMSIAEAAEMLGVSRHALYAQRCLHRGASLQLIVDMYRWGEIGKGVRGEARHRVHGQWTTTRREAERLGVSSRTIEKWRTDHRRPDGGRALLEEAVEHYEALARGEIAPPRSGPEPRRYWVRGKRMTIAEAAALVGAKECSLRAYIWRRRCSVDAAVKRLEAKRRKQAEQEILKILTEE